MSELEDMKASLCADINKALSNPVKPTREQADQAVGALFDWVKPFIETSLDRMVKEGVLRRDSEPPSIEIRPIPFDRISEEDKAARRVPLEIIGTENADLP